MPTIEFPSYFATNTRTKKRMHLANFLIQKKQVLRLNHPSHCFCHTPLSPANEIYFPGPFPLSCSQMNELGFLLTPPFLVNVFHKPSTIGSEPIPTAVSVPGEKNH